MTTPTVAHNLLEREAELALIDGRLANAREGRGAVLVIEGSAGIGKTELLRAARERAINTGMEILTARGGELEQNLAFGIVRQLFERRLARARPPVRRSLLAGAAGFARPAFDLGDRVPATDSASIAAGDPAAAIHHGLYWLCANLCERSPLAILVDDLHWADSASVRWLIYLARRLEDLGALVVATVRPGEPGLAPGLLVAVCGEPVTSVVRPTPLSESATGELIEDELGDPDKRFRAACHRATGGNPFLLVELIGAMREDAIPPTAESVGRIDELAPETVSRSILLRLARLPEGAESLAQAISVLGIEAEVHHAATLGDLDEATAAAAADALAAASVLAPGRPLRFAHPLLRTAVYEQTPASERARAHARAARLLADAGAPAEEVASQLLVAEPAADAWVVATLCSAAEQATARGAPDAAVAYLRRAFDEGPGPARRGELLAKLALASYYAGEPTMFDRLREALAEVDLPGSATLADEYAMAAQAYGHGYVEESVGVLDRLISSARASGETDLALALEASLINAAKFDPDFGPRVMERLARIPNDLPGKTTAERSLIANLAVSKVWAFEPADRAAELAERVVGDGCLRPGQTADSPGYRECLGILLLTERLDLAERCLEAMTSDAHRRGSAVSYIFVCTFRSHLRYLQGSLRDAEVEARTALDVAAQQRWGIRANPWGLAFMLDILVERGELDDAEKLIADVQLREELPEMFFFHALLASRARLRFAQGKRDLALEDFAKVRSRGERWGAARWMNRGWIADAVLALAAAGRELEAREWAADNLASARRWGTPIVLATAIRTCALVADAEHRLTLLDEARSLLGPSAGRLELARVLTDLGATVRRAKRRSEARETLRNALDLAHRCGATLLSERAHAELAATGAKPRRMMLSGVESLTPSELRIAKLAAEGMQNKEIAQTLFVSVKTVETHLGHVYGKLGIDSRTKLAGRLKIPT
jgi:DNA-binding CsgD family transcriptional regulator